MLPKEGCRFWGGWPWDRLAPFISGQVDPVLSSQSHTRAIVERATGANPTMAEAVTMVVLTS